MRNLVVLFIQFHRHPDPVARTWRRLFPSYGVASPQAPTPDCESLPATISESIRVRPHPCRLAGAGRPATPGCTMCAASLLPPLRHLDEAKHGSQDTRVLTRIFVWPMF